MSRKSIYIKLFKMRTEEYTSYEKYKLLYSLVVVSRGERIGLVEGKVLSHPVYKSGEKEYLLRHECLDREE
jgi:hypothetical protein